MDDEHRRTLPHVYSLLCRPVRLAHGAIPRAAVLQQLIGGEHPQAVIQRYEQLLVRLGLLQRLVLLDDMHTHTHTHTQNRTRTQTHVSADLGRYQASRAHLLVDRDVVEDILVPVDGDTDVAVIELKQRIIARNGVSQPVALRASHYRDISQ